MTASERLRSCWSPSRLVHHAISGHRSEASFRSYIGRPSSEKIITCSDILSDTSSGRPHQSLQPSFTALSSRAILITSRVSPYTSFVLKPLPACFINRAQSRLLYLLTRIQELLSNLDEKRWLPAVDTDVHHIKNKWKIKNERKCAIAPELLSG